MDARSYTLADLTRLAGAKRRAVQMWAEAGALLAFPMTERGGSGTHRLFDRDEAIIACILNGFHLQGVPIGKLLQASVAIRAGFGAPRRFLREPIEDAIEGEGANFLLFDQTTGVNVWTSKYSSEPLEETLRTTLRSSLSWVVVSLNGCLARMKSSEFPRTK